jgi:hypothetical protein
LKNAFISKTKIQIEYWGMRIKMIRTLHQNHSGSKATLDGMIDSWNAQLLALHAGLDNLRTSDGDDFETSKMYLQSLLDNLSDSVTSFEMSQA